MVKKDTRYGTRTMLILDFFLKKIVPNSVLAGWGRWMNKETYKNENPRWHLFSPFNLRLFFVEIFFSTFNHAGVTMLQRFFFDRRGQTWRHSDVMFGQANNTSRKCIEQCVKLMPGGRNVALASIHFFNGKGGMLLNILRTLSLIVKTYFPTFW